MEEGKKAREPRHFTEYFVRLYSHLPSLIIANVLFLLVSLPIITAGPSLIALNRIACAAVNNDDINTVSEFFHTWKKEFKSGLFLNLTLIPLFVFLTVISLQLIRDLQINGWSISSILIISLYLAFCSFLMYFLPLLAYMDANGLQIIRNAFYLCFANGIKTVLGSVITGFMILAGLGFYPRSFPLIILILFSLAAYNACYYGWNAAKEFIFRPYYQAHPEEQSIIDLD